MARRPFTRKKGNETKNLEAYDTFKLFNRLAPSTRERYIDVIEKFADFLLVHHKSLWDADFEDLRKFLNQTDIDTARGIISTFYRVLEDSGEYKKNNPVIELNRIEREEAKQAKKDIKPLSRAETVLQELEEPIEEKIETKKKKETTSKISKRIMILSDLENLLMRASHIRDRAILEAMYATGAQIQEIIKLNVADVDLEAKTITFQNTDGHFRTLIIPKRTVNFLKIYERWRRRQISPSQAYFITKSTKKRMSGSSISTWLQRIQKDREERERWSAIDFRKRALLQHYWITRDLTAVARFGGYIRPESALNLISDVLSDQGVDSIDALASLPEFEALKTDNKKLATVGSEDEMTITVQLDKEQMEALRKSGLTPTQAVKSVLSFKDLLGFSGGTLPGGTKAGPALSNKPSSNVSAPTNVGMPQADGGPKIMTPTSGGPNLSSAGPNLSATSPGPNLNSSGPNLSTPSGTLEINLSKAPVSDNPASTSSSPPTSNEPSTPSPMDQMSELKSILAKRRQRQQEIAQDGENKETDIPTRSGLGAVIKDANGDDKESSEDKNKKKDEEKEEVPELPDFDF